MNISMWTLYDELRPLGVIPLIYDGDNTFGSFQVLSSDNSDDILSPELFSPNIVYIGFLSEYFSALRESIFLVNKNDIIIIQSNDLFFIINRIVAIFDKYAQFDASLHYAMFQPEALQALLDAAHEMFNCPMFFGHKSLRIYAITRQYDDSEVYNGWNRIKSTLFMTPEIVRKSSVYQSSFLKYPESIDPAVIPIFPEIAENSAVKYQVRVIIRYQNETWGHLYLYHNEKTISPSRLMLARYVGDLFEQLISQMTAAKPNAFETYSPLVEYLAGANISSDAILSLQNHLGFLGDVQFTLYKIVIDSSSQAFFSYLLDSLRSLSSREIVFPYQDSIVYISTDDAGIVDSSLQHLPNRLGLTSIRCGVSFPFSDLTSLKQAFFQADYALRYAVPQESVFYRFETVPFSGMIEYLKNSCEWRPFVPPSLKKLIDSDLENRTDYTHTLLVYLLNYGRAADTADQLFIHRNTLRYRLERIKDICGIDAQDNQTSIFLRFCFSLLEDDLREVFHSDGPV